MALDLKDYLNVIEKTTLTSIDLVIVYDNKILMGYRNNDPARNYWFVPGCRTRKNETQQQGIQRVANSELGIDIDTDTNKLKLLGVYDHLYDCNFKNDDFGTHYVVAAYVIILEQKPTITGDDQHEKLDWFSINKIEEDDNIHQYTKNYVKPVLDYIKE